MIKNNIQKDIETAIGHQALTPKDFNELSDMIFARTGQTISTHTLKRLWGYLSSEIVPRRSTLDILARFIGYRNFQDYQTNSLLPGERQSSPVMSHHISTVDIPIGAFLRLTWKPGRVCDIVYLGDETFRVISSENTRLLPGDTFRCSLFVESEPLYIDRLIHGTNPPVAYVCGKISGITFEFLPYKANKDVK